MSEEPTPQTGADASGEIPAADPPGAANGHAHEPVDLAALGRPEGAEPAANAGAAEPAATPEVAAEPTSPPTAPDRQERVSIDDLRPVEIVRRLDEYIVGQAAAKKAVAVALRNRVRRQKLAPEMRAEVLPKNILMIGPTGVGKTEIARRLARMTHSPFIKVEATKFTEVGYVGRDVESIIRDLLEQTITEVHNDRLAEVEERATQAAELRILDALVEAELRQEAKRPPEPSPAAPGDSSASDTRPSEPAPADAGPDGTASTPPLPEGVSVPPPEGGDQPASPAAPAGSEEAARRRRRLLRRRLERRLEQKQLEDREVDVEVEEPWQPAIEGFGGSGFEDFATGLSDFFSQMAPPRKRVKRMTVAEARTVLTQDESDRLVDMERVYDDAIADVEERGIVFVDEIDKIAGPGSETGPDISGQGVQRDLLPLLEGSTVHTRYGAVHTDHVLFIAAGAFTMSRPSDLIPELQGRFPIRVELSALTEADLQRILVEPSNALTKQYTALLATEEVTLGFTEDGIRELAATAARVNEEDENIGARRLFTILEKVLEEVSFSAEDHTASPVAVDAEFVRSRLRDLVRNEDVRRYVL